MNRELRFRAYNGETMNYNIMVGKFGAFWINPGTKNNGLDEKDSASLTPFNTKCAETTIVMQSTGLNDINDTPIFEGDIVKCSYGKGKVVWKAGCFMVEWIDDKEAYLEFVFSRKGMYVRKDDERFEIIGNTYENPELLVVA